MFSFRARLLAGASHALLLSLALASAARAQDPAPTAAAASATDQASAAAAESSSGVASEVVIKGKARSSATTQLQDVGPLGNRPLLETPMSISAVDSQKIGKIAATTVDAAFSYDASLRTNNSGVASGNTFASRGQTVDLTFGYRYDGLPFPYWFQDQPIESLDSIQVLKGTGGFVYGYASPAGVVNFVSKKPTNEFQSVFDVSYRSSSILRELIDVGGPVTEDGSTAFRLNIVNEQGTLYNGAYNSDRFISLWLQGDFTSKLSWSLNGFYQRTLQSHESNGISIGPGVTSLAPVDGAHFNLGSPSSHKQNDVSQLTGRLNYQLTPDWKLSGALRYAVLDERFPGDSPQITSNAGAYKLGLLDMNRYFDYTVGQLNVDGNFNTGPVKHNLIAGFDYLDDVFIYAYQDYTATGIPTTDYGPFDGISYTGNIYSGQNSAPSWSNNPAAVAYQKPPNWFKPVYQEIHEKGLYLSDTLKYGPAELLLGARYTFYNEADLPVGPLSPGATAIPPPLSKTVTRREFTLTPVIAPSIEIVPGVRAYVSYVQALATGGIVPTPFENEGTVLAPTISTQWEVGIKAQRSNWDATLAAFHTTTPAVVASNVTTPVVGQIELEGGEARYEGIEFNGDYRVNREWALNLSVASLDALEVKALAGSATPAGSEVPETVKFRATSYIDYSPNFAPGLTAFGGVRYTGSARGQANNTFYFPSSTVGDLGVTYRLPTERNIQLQVNIQNVADAKYWVPGSTATAISSGEPRTFTVSISFKGGPGRGAGEGATPFNSAYGGWYVGGEGGGVFPSSETYSLKSDTNPNQAVGELGTKRDIGGEFSAVLGRDFGLFRAEVESDYSWAGLQQVTLNGPASAIPINNPSLTPAQIKSGVGALGTGSAAGTYNNPIGGSTVLAFLANGLINIGDGKSSPWSFEAGGGVGLGVVRSQDKWRLASNQPYFQDDSSTGFAWQALARVRHRITDHIDATLTYHYLDVTHVGLQTASGNTLKGSFGENGLRAGLTYNF